MCASAGIAAILLVPPTAPPLLPLFMQMCVSAGKVVAFASTHAPAYRPLPFKVPLPCFANVRCELWLWCVRVCGGGFTVLVQIVARGWHAACHCRQGRVSVCVWGLSPRM